MSGCNPPHEDIFFTLVPVKDVCKEEIDNTCRVLLKACNIGEQEKRALPTVL